MKQNSSHSLHTRLLKYAIVKHKRAVPLSVTTRGVGFATAITFDRLVTSFEGKLPEVPLSIHQMFRVHLWAVHYKLYLTGKATMEVPSFPMPFVLIPPSAEQAMQLVKLLPSVMSMILDCVGRLETPLGIYFGCYGHPPAAADALLDYRATTINPDNIRELLNLAARGTEAERRRLRQLWSIPGARFSEDGVLENGDDIYPPVYGSDQLITDVQTYMAFAIRLRNRFPSHLFQDIVWSSHATPGMLWSTPVLEVALQSHFLITDAPVTNRRKKKQGGTYVEAERQEVRGARYLRSTVPPGRLSRFTSFEDTSNLLTVVGCTSLVGEESGLPGTRNCIGHSYIVSIVPLSTMSAMLYAP